ncbi:hypothetical protein GCM10017688_53840 [Streptomyces ramulosus]
MVTVTTRTRTYTRGEKPSSSACQAFAKRAREGGGPRPPPGRAAHPTAPAAPRIRVRPAPERRPSDRELTVP